MPSTTLKRRRTEEGLRGKTPKKPRKYIKRQTFYHSSSEDEGEGVARDAPREVAPVSRESSDDEAPQRKPRSILKSNPAQKTDKKKTAASKEKEKKKGAPPTAPAEDKDENEEEDEIVGDEDEDEDDSKDSAPGSEDDNSDDSDASLSETSTNNPARAVRKRNDPEAFATSISRILNTKLTSQKRSEPILSRSKDAQYANKSLSDQLLTHKAHKQLLAEKKAAQEKGHVKDVMGLNDVTISTQAATAKEKELRRTAQKGVIKLFNAVRAAQVKGEQAEREAREQGLVGISKREEQVKEVSKQGFLDMITASAKPKPTQ